MKLRKHCALSWRSPWYSAFSPPAAATEVTSNTPTPEYAYVPTYTELSRDIGYVYNTVRSGDLIYFVAK